MIYSNRFVSASHEYMDLDRPINAPLFRKSVTIANPVQKAELTVCGLGFYELFVNGCKKTKGLLAPYISNPDDIRYYDTYDITDLLNEGENALGFLLGNGFLNNPGGAVWNFDKVPWRTAPMLAFALELTYADGTAECIEADETVRCAPSAITFDDLRSGEDYDARFEEENWCCAGFDDSAWDDAFSVIPPRGEARLVKADPIRVVERIAPVEIVKEDEGVWRYDFGVNDTGLFELCIKGKSGQRVHLELGEVVIDGKLDTTNIHFDWKPLRVQEVNYTLSGKGEERYIPHFTYFGYRYIRISGITEAQATESLLTMLRAHSDFTVRGSFFCSDETVNTLQTLTCRSTLANFVYFPNDCPHREKNGWTGDASLSAEQTTLNFSPEKSYAEWLRNIAKAQSDIGRLPGIIPTGGWGLTWGNGPAWDSALFETAYQTWRYRGDKSVIRENAHTFMRYLTYIRSMRLENGLVACGLGDWLQPYGTAGEYSTPLEVTDSIYTMNNARQAAEMLRAVGMDAEADYAKRLADEMREAIRRELVAFPECKVSVGTQSAQAMAIYYGVFNKEESRRAFSLLLDAIDREDGKMYCGILGCRAIFHVLAAFGYVDLALSMITREDFPSFGGWIKEGATSLWEGFTRPGEPLMSLNHHLWGDMSAFFYKDIAGINVNPNGRGADTLCFAPNFPSTFTFAEASYETVCGKAAIRWEKLDETHVALDFTVPDGLYAEVRLPEGWLIDDQCSPSQTRVMPGRHVAVKRRV